jgi:glycosidase
VDDAYGVRSGAQRVVGETPDPATWQWTESDRVFLRLVEEAHAQGLRLVIDGVFNHVGPEFWAWRDVRERGRRSRYAEWFDVVDWGTPMRWNAWDGPNGRLVRFKHHGDGLHPEVEAYLLAVVGRWMDPNRDGDPADGIDGWRLDAAEQVPHGFWRRLRETVERCNNEAVLVGELWGDARPWLAGDQFDAATNYPYSAAVMRFFGQAGDAYQATSLCDDLGALRRRHDWSTTLGMLNLLDSHDTERAVSMLIDPQLRSGPSGNIPRRDLLKPDEDAYRRVKLAALLQFTWPGAPLIYYGDEAGMYGGRDPYCRAPMWWPEMRVAAYRADMLGHYRWLCRLRAEHAELRRGRCRLILGGDAQRLIAFGRTYRRQETVVLINAGRSEAEVCIAVGEPDGEVTVQTLDLAAESGQPEARRIRRIGQDGRLTVRCPSLGAILLRREG